MAKTEIKPIVAIVGSDPFLQSEEVAAIVAALKGAQRRDFDGERAELADVLDEVRSYSMFGDSKLAIVRDADEFLTRYREKLEDFVVEVGEGKTTPTGVLVLRLASLPGNQRIAKAIAKAGEVRKCEPPRDAELPGWIQKRVKTHHTDIEPAAAKALADLIGADLGRLDSELAKLAIASGSGKITVAEVSTSVSFQREQEIKEVTALLGRGRAEDAVRKWRHLMVADSSAEFRAVTWLGMWLERCRAALGMKEKGMPLQAMARTLWINDPTELKEFVGVATKLGPAGVTRLLGRLTEIDRRIKSGLGSAAENVERFMATALVDS